MPRRAGTLPPLAWGSTDPPREQREQGAGAGVEALPAGRYRYVFVRSRQRLQGVAGLDRKPGHARANPELGSSAQDAEQGDPTLSLIVLVVDGLLAGFFLALVVLR